MVISSIALHLAVECYFKFKTMRTELRYSNAMSRFHAFHCVWIRFFIY